VTSAATVRPRRWSRRWRKLRSTKASLDHDVRSRGEPAAALERLASTIFGFCKGTKHMTMLYGVLDRELLQLRYSNAGHTFPCYYRRREDRMIPLAHAGAPIGFEPNVRYTEKLEQLERGDILLLYSDGMIEARDRAGSARSYGLRRLKETVKQHADLSANDLASALIDDVLAYSKGETADDMTTIVVKIAA
jgi:phosphoserine phosphatase RsbU/P